MTLQFEQKQESEVHFKMVLHGKVNGSKVLVTGSGRTLESKGLLWGKYTLDQFPKKVDPRFLNAFVITGHSATSKNLDGVVNPFRPITHEYERVVTFNDGHELALKAYCKRNGNQIDSDFELNGTVGEYRLVSAEPLVEAWVPLDSKTIHGHFSIMWLTDEKKYVVGDSETRYRLARSQAGESVLHRFITIQSQVDGSHFAQNQQVTLFRNFPGHSTEVAPGFM